jgi:hypothetical protein
MDMHRHTHACVVDIFSYIGNLGQDKVSSSESEGEGVTAVTISKVGISLIISALGGWS